MSSNRTYIGIDGIERNKDEDLRISLDVHSLFKTPTGQSVLKYLRKITIETVNGPNVNDATLRHLEGQRYVYAILERRINHAMKEKKNV